MSVQLHMEFQDEKGNHIIKVIGVGGGGSNAVTNMYTHGIKGVDFYIMNTDNQALDGSPVQHKMQLGPLLTEGHGAGARPEIGREAAIESREDIERMFDDSTKMVFITAGLGGGTGTGAAPLVASVAKEKDILTVAIVTLPFRFEGPVRRRHAKAGLDALKENVDTYIVISNDKLQELHANSTATEAFAFADNILTTAAKGIAEIITVRGHINVDIEDVNTVMRDSGPAIMGVGYGSGDDRALKAVEQAVNSPLLEDNSIIGAKNILLNITSGTQEATMSEIGTITDFIWDQAGEEVNVIWGNAFDQALGDKLAVTVIATGFQELEIDDLQGTRQKEQPKKTEAAEESKDQPLNSQADFQTHSAEPTHQTIDLNQEVQHQQQAMSSGGSFGSHFGEKPDRRPPVSIDKSDDLRRIESEPAYLRRGVKLVDTASVEGQVQYRRLDGEELRDA